MGGFEPASPTVRTADHRPLVISGSQDAAAGQVLKATGPGAAEWGNAGGGGFGGVAVLSPLAVDTVDNGSGRQLRPGDWAAVPYDGGAMPAIVNNSEQRTFGFADAGWYRLTVFVSLGFTQGATALPDHYSVQFIEWNAQSGFAHDVPCTPGEGYAMPAQSRSQHGGSAVLPSYAFYTPGAGVTLGNEIQLVAGYPGDATASSAGGGPLTAGAFKVYIERVA